MKRMLVCLILIFGFAAINPICSMASEDELDFSYLIKPSENIISVSSEHENIKIEIAGKNIEFTNKPFIDENGRTQVPVRELCEFLNKRVYWFENPQRVAISTVPADLDKTNGGGAGGDSIQFVIGEPKYTVNGREYPMDTSARLTDGKTYVPLRILGEFLNYKVTWQE